jgi:tetratricopeptide (TPR) repeat protein
MRSLRIWFWPLILSCVLAVGTATAAGPMSRSQALKALVQPEPTLREAAIARLADIGTMADAPRLVDTLRDEEPVIRDEAASALWQIWSRSGDAAVDKLLVRGTLQLQASALEDARLTFDQIVRRRPGFAEGWNKRATVLFLMGRLNESLRDVDQALRRNPYHFGALSGAGQIHFRLGNDQRALAYFQRALAVNPNLEGLEEMIEAVEARLQERLRNST